MGTLKDVKSKLAEANKPVNDFINNLVDAHTFVETDAFMCDDSAPGGVVSGFAQINDTKVSIFVINGNSLKGGIGANNAKKITKCVYGAVNFNAPLIAVVDTAGARFGEGVQALEAYYKIFAAFKSAYGEVPVITVNKGNNLGLLSYLSEFSDFTICLADSVTATASPLVLSAKSGIAQNKIGTAQACLANGAAACVVKDGNELKKLIVDILDLQQNPVAEPKDDPNRVCKALKAGMEPLKLIEEAFDKATFMQTMSAYAKEVITGFARLNGFAVGVVASNGAIDGGRLTHEGASKVITHINAVENMGLPLIYLVDSLGTAVNADKDFSLLSNVGVLLYNSVANENNLKISVVYGKSVGAAYPLFIAPAHHRIAWDSAHIGVLEDEAAARLVYSEEIAKAKDKEKELSKLSKAYGEQHSDALTVSANGFLDHVIEPQFTRQYLIAALQAFLQ